MNGYLRSGVAVLALVVGVLGSAAGQDEKQPVCTGTIKKVSAGLGAILVESPNIRGDLWLDVSETTRLSKRLGKEIQPARFSDLNEGQRVEFPEPRAIFETKPPRASVTELVILPGEVKK